MTHLLYFPPPWPAMPIRGFVVLQPLDPLLQNVREFYKEGFMKISIHIFLQPFLWVMTLVSYFFCAKLMILPCKLTSDLRFSRIPHCFHIPKRKSHRTSILVLVTKLFVGARDSDRPKICDTVTNKDPLSISPFGNTHEVSEFSPEMLMGDCWNQVSAVWHDCLMTIDKLFLTDIGYNTPLLIRTPHSIECCLFNPLCKPTMTMCGVRPPT